MFRFKALDGKMAVNDIYNNVPTTLVAMLLTALVHMRRPL